MTIHFKAVLQMNSKNLLLATSISGFLSVAIGAFGAHALKSQITPDLLVIFETGNKYQFYHTFASLAAILFYLKTENQTFLKSSLLFLLGILFFSGSLYTLAVTGVRSFGAITPVGGVFFLSGWILLTKAGLRNTV